MKLLLDTDIGSDIDDAVCLAYLLAQPACELLGITTVTGEPEQRAMLASALCHVAGKQVPIFPGAAAPLSIAQMQPAVPQIAALDRWAHDADFPRGEAVAFLQQTIRENPGEVTLLAIGPLTNIALLFASDPEAAALLHRLVIMGGWFDDRAGAAPAGMIDWNLICDPHAAAIVYRTPVPQHRSVGIEITQRVSMTATVVRERFTAPLLRPVLDFAEVWFDEQVDLTFHDPLAAATCFNEAICGFTPGTVALDPPQPGLHRLTDFAPDAHGPHAVATSVDTDRFFAHFFATLG